MCNAVITLGLFGRQWKELDVHKAVKAKVIYF